MKAFVIAETADAQRELCAGARTLADEELPTAANVIAAALNQA